MLVEEVEPALQDEPTFNLPCEARMPEANYRMQAQAKTAAMIREQAGGCMADRRGKDCTCGREQHEGVERRAVEL